MIARESKFIDRLRESVLSRDDVPHEIAKRVSSSDDSTPIITRQQAKRVHALGQLAGPGVGVNRKVNPNAVGTSGSLDGVRVRDASIVHSWVELGNVSGQSMVLPALCVDHGHGS